jgi:hypothetical protein
MTRKIPAALLPCVLLASMLGGCAATPSAPVEHCPMTGQKAMTIVRLYFGRDIAGRGPVSDQEWSEFARTVLTPQFPDGLTAFKGNGQWLDPATGNVVREDSVVVEVAFDAGTDYARRVDTVVAAYKQQFHQEAVGIISESACGHF